jgi:hypothetical protein
MDTTLPVERIERLEVPNWHLNLGRHAVSPDGVNRIVFEAIKQLFEIESKPPKIYPVKFTRASI